MTLVDVPANSDRLNNDVNVENYSSTSTHDVASVNINGGGEKQHPSTDTLNPHQTTDHLTSTSSNNDFAQPSFTQHDLVSAVHLQEPQTQRIASSPVTRDTDSYDNSSISDQGTSNAGQFIRPGVAPTLPNQRDSFHDWSKSQSSQSYSIADNNANIYPIFLPPPLSINPLFTLPNVSSQKDGSHHTPVSLREISGGDFSENPRILNPSSNSIRLLVDEPQLKRPTPEPLTKSGCRYPVLYPIRSQVDAILPMSEACCLLEQYFAPPSISLFECASPYVITQVFRPKSFLRQDRPRRTSPALLVAMLWVSAQTSDAPIFKSSPRARPRICDQLYRACIGLLDSTVHEEQSQKPCTFPRSSCVSVADYRSLSHTCCMGA